MIYLFIQQWAKEFYEASISLQNREEKLEAVAEKIEKVGKIFFKF